MGGRRPTGTADRTARGPADEFKHTVESPCGAIIAGAIEHRHGVYLKLLGDTHFGMYTSDGHAGMIVLCGHWRGGPALGREPLASPAAPADGPGLHQHVRLTALRTRQRASTLAHARRRTGRRRIGPGMPTLHTWHTGPHSAGSRSPAPRLQRTGLVRISICGSRRVERPYGRPQPITPAAAPTADEWARPVDPASAPAQARTRPAAARQPRGASERAWCRAAPSTHGALDVFLATLRQAATRAR